ncbi:hypothetical protein Pelo_7963 [Pelomyxa schiedti]|nr:hypothetical protein Pelo_7963 [Pelomyxa schiedti]
MDPTSVSSSMFGGSSSSSSDGKWREASQLETYVLSITCGTLSIVGCLIVFASYALFPEQRTRPRFLILMLSFCDFGQALFFCIVGDFHGIGCSILAAYGIFFALTTFFWTACISLYSFAIVREMYNKMVNHKEPSTKRYSLIWFHFVSWGLPALLTLAALLAGKLETDPEGYWCFISSEYEVWRTVVFVVPLLGCWCTTVTFTVISNFLVVKTKRYIFINKARQSEKSRLVEQSTWSWQLRMLLVPTIFFVCRVWDVIYRIDEIVCQFEDKEPLGVFQAWWYTGLIIIGDSTQGLANCLVFVIFEKETMVRWSFWIRGLFSKRRLQPGLIESDGVALVPELVDQDTPVNSH